MTSPYKQLIKDHIHLTHILNLLVGEIDQCDSEAWSHPNLTLILDGLEYMSSYSEMFHHPLEEAAFDYLVESGKGDAAVICGIREQHIELEKETSLLQEQFTQVANYNDVSNRLLRRRFRDYLEFQREHILVENKRVFPLLEQLSRTEWKDIAIRVALLKDPVFDVASRREFSELYRQIDKDNMFYAENGSY